MKKIKYSLAIFFIVAAMEIVWTGCSDRFEKPIKGEDSTLIYQSKSAIGIEAKITFCEKINKKTGKPIKVGTVFSVRENSRVNAVIELINMEFKRNKNLMFHIVWLDSIGNSFYKKRIDIPPNDSSAILRSSINISPNKRQLGNYSLRVYVFRELMAEKKFQLVKATVDSATVILQQMMEIIKAEIDFCRSFSKKTGRLIGVGTVFKIKNKAKVSAIVGLENQDMFKNQKKVFYLDWIGLDGNSFYKKKIELLPNDSSKTLSSSISISPKKRQPGNYFLRVYLFNKIISEKTFELISQID